MIQKEMKCGGRHNETAFQKMEHYDLKQELFFQVVAKDFQDFSDVPSLNRINQA